MVVQGTDCGRPGRRNKREDNLAGSNTEAQKYGNAHELSLLTNVRIRSVPIFNATTAVSYDVCGDESQKNNFSPASTGEGPDS